MKAGPMTLEFPNPSRNFDRTRNAVRFVGHDGMFEVPFAVDAQALGGADEDLCLSAFDAGRGRIEAAARKIYSRGRKSEYFLSAENLR